MSYDAVIGLINIPASILFVLGLKLLRKMDTAKKGNQLAAVGMLIAVIASLASSDIVNYEWIVSGILLGAIIGILAARNVVMTSMPEMVALFNGFGGASSLLVGYAGYYSITGVIPDIESFAIIVTIVIGALAFSGSLIAYAKLAEYITIRLDYLPKKRFVNYALLTITMILSICFLVPELRHYQNIIGITAGVVAIIFGATIVIPIGGANMPLVISLHNGLAGLAAAGAGFVVNNTLLIVTGSLVSASGFVLTTAMCKAMNRSFSSVLLSGFTRDSIKLAGQDLKGEVKPISLEDAFSILESARSVVIVPGYGLAVAQAQHAVKDLCTRLEENGAEVVFAIHPVAGRMPGHMNVLLAEANVPYDKLIGPEDINPRMETVDLCIVIGANDVVNPIARTDPSSPIYGMPIIEAEKARTVFVLKRSMGFGFSGVDNPLFFNENTRMLFGDAKDTLNRLTTEFKLES